MPPSRKKKLEAVRFHDSQGLHKIARREEKADAMKTSAVLLVLGNTSDITKSVNITMILKLGSSIGLQITD